MRRVVITGMGLITPLGVGKEYNWARLIESQSGIRSIDTFDVSDLPSKIAGQVPTDASRHGSFLAHDFVTPKEQRKINTFILYTIAAVKEALADSGWTPQTEEDYERTGVLIGSGIGGLYGIYDASIALKELGPRRVKTFFIPSSLINLASGHISILYGFKGPNHSVVTACSSGTHAIGDASRIIQFDDAEVMIAGGSEASVVRLGVAGFCALKALSTRFNNTPECASRPYDQDRDGFVIGEGSGVVILEELEHARKRGAPIYAEIIGYGMSGDAYHITAPPEDGNGARRSMFNALRHAKLSPDDLDYINAHGTSTPMGDDVEVRTVKKILGSAAEHVSMSSTKSSIGHLLGAAGAVEAIYTIMAINQNTVPPTLNLENPSPDCEGLDLVPQYAKQKKVTIALSNSFGFGGTNATLIFKEYSSSSVHL